MARADLSIPPGFFRTRVSIRITALTVSRPRILSSRCPRSMIMPLNRALLDLIIEAQPDSITELAELSGRAKGNLSRTLKTMERYGLVTLSKGIKGRIKPRVPYSGIVLNVPVMASAERVSSAQGA